MYARSSTTSAGLTLLFVSAFAGQASAKDRFDIGELVQSFTLKSINSEVSGETYVSIEKFYGPDAKTPKKATLLSFFATYCGPCKREMPYLAALYDTYKERGLQVLLVTIDKDAPKIDEAKALADAAGVKFPVLSDRFNIVAKRYYIEKLPCIYIVDGSGKVAVVNVGYSGDVSKSLLDSVRQMIGEPVTDPVPEALVKYINHAPEAGEASPPAAGDAVAAANTPPAGDAAPAADATAEVEEKGKKGKAKKKGKKKGK